MQLTVSLFLMCSLSLLLHADAELPTWQEMVHLAASSPAGYDNIMLANAWRLVKRIIYKYQLLQICWVGHALGLDIPNKSQSLRAGTIILHQTKHRYPEHRTQQQLSCKNTLGKRCFSSSSSWCTTPWYLHSWHILYVSNIIQPYSKDKQTHHLYLYMRAYMQLIIWYHRATFLQLSWGL